MTPVGRLSVRDTLVWAIAVDVVLAMVTFKTTGPPPFCFTGMNSLLSVTGPAFVRVNVAVAPPRWYPLDWH